MSAVWFLSHILTGRLPCYIVVPGYTVYLDKLKSRLLDTLFRAYRHGQTEQLPEGFLFVGFGIHGFVARVRTRPFPASGCRIKQCCNSLFPNGIAPLEGAYTCHTGCLLFGVILS